MTALASATPVSSHFTAAELGADNPAIDDASLHNLQTVVAPWLESMRLVLGVPLRVTSGYRTAADNSAVGGVSDSDHLRGLAADVEPVGLAGGWARAWYLLHQAGVTGALPAWDQLIYYPGDGHIHVGLGPQLRRQESLGLKGDGATATEYVAATADSVARFL